MASVDRSTRLFVRPGSATFATIADWCRFTEGPAPLSSGDGFLPGAGDGGGRFEAEVSVGDCDYDSNVQHRRLVSQSQRVGTSSSEGAGRVQPSGGVSEQSRSAGITGQLERRVFLR